LPQFLPTSLLLQFRTRKKILVKSCFCFHRNQNVAENNLSSSVHLLSSSSKKQGCQMAVVYFKAKNPNLGITRKAL
jgi:UDP-N-acetylglucosamine 2-epimerase